MATGTVKWFNNAKGFGFICPEGEEGDIFAHYSTIQMEGYRTLKAGQQVDYEVESGPKGSHASSVVPVEGSVAKQAIADIIFTSTRPVQGRSVNKNIKTAHLLTVIQF